MQSSDARCHEAKSACRSCLSRQNKPYINGGVKGLVAQYMEFSSTNLVEHMVRL